MAKKEMSIAQLKNLPQYSDKTDAELKEIREKILTGGLKGRVEDTVEEIKADYDISDMTANDKFSLYELARAFVTAEDLQRDLREAQEEGDWGIYGKINRELHRTRDDISDLQDYLNITRKAREKTGKHSLVEFIEDLKQRGRKFLDQKLSEIYCPQCEELICKAWFLYPEENNAIKLYCERCGNKFTIKSKDIEDNKNIDVGPPIQ